MLIHVFLSIDNCNESHELGSWFKLLGEQESCVLIPQNKHYYPNMPWLSGIPLSYDCNCLCAHLRLRPPRRRRVRRRARGPLLPRQTTSRDWVSAAAAPPYSEHGAALRGCTRHNSSPDSTSGFMHHACSQEHFR